MFKFFVVPGSRKALFDMPDIDTLKIIKINCDTICTHGNDSANNCNTNTAICQSSKHMQYYKNTMQGVDRAEKSCVNTDATSNLKIKISQWLLIKSITK